MPTFKVTAGALTLASVGSNYPDNSLPGDQPGIDNSLPGGVPPIGVTLPEPPPGIWPPPSFTRPIVPVPPNSTLPIIPGTIWPSPGRPVDPGYGRPDIGAGHPDAGLPAPPGAHPGHDLPGGGQIDNSLPSQTYWMLCYCQSLGWRYVSVDPSLRPGHDLPPHAQPK